MIDSNDLFSNLETEIINRLRQSKNIIKIITDLEKEKIESELIKTQKGLLFVLLYGSIEYALTASVSTYISLINKDPQEILKYKKYFLAVILNSELESIRDCGKKSLWDKKSHLFETLFSDERVNINETIFPTDGINISSKHFADIWKTLHLELPILPETVNAFILQEIKENRNSISHGRLKASEIGSRYTTSELSAKEHDVESICLHVTSTMKTSFEKRLYLYTSQEN